MADSENSELSGTLVLAQGPISNPRHLFDAGGKGCDVKLIRTADSVTVNLCGPNNPLRFIIFIGDEIIDRLAEMRQSGLPQPMKRQWRP